MRTVNRREIAALLSLQNRYTGNASNEKTNHHLTTYQSHHTHIHSHNITYHPHSQCDQTAMARTHSPRAYTDTGACARARFVCALPA